MKFPLHCFAGILVTISTMSCSSEPVSANPVEVGKVAWERDYHTAVKSSKDSGKPIFLLFQEVPGCAGCKQFGQEVLSDASVVKGIEENFVPLLIHNNKQGKMRRF
ncbi:MAG: thioredoxin family protein [Akkermansiaceae bacterium]|nr:thioredoxin family protein [Akkermansiaceae bacterium]